MYETKTTSMHFNTIYICMQKCPRNKQSRGERIMARNNYYTYLPFEKVDKEVGQSILNRRESSNINSLKCHLKLSEETAFYFGLFGLWSEQRDILQVLQIVHINFSVYDTELHAALPATATIH